MRVALLMPMHPESAIADVTLQVLPELARTWDVEIWCPFERTLRDAPVQVRTFGPDDRADMVKRLREYELVVYVLGNSPWHAEILVLSRAVPGLVIVHDAALTGLVWHLFVKGQATDDIPRHIAERYGDEAVEGFESPSTLTASGGWMGYCARVPLSEYAMEHALGVVVHSPWHAELVAGQSLGEVSVAPLPVPLLRADDRERENEAAEAVLRELPDDALLVVTVGHVNENRCVDVMLRAIASDPVLAGRLHLWAVGQASASTSEALLSLAGELGLGSRFAIPGRVTDGQLRGILARADIGVALRDPVLEGQSASVLTILESGTPTVVYDHAHYADLPDDLAVKIPVGGADEDLSAALRRLVVDDVARRHMGERARAFVDHGTRRSRYAKVVLTAAAGALAARTRARMVDDVANRLDARGLSSHSVVIDNALAVLGELVDFGAPADSTTH